MAIETRPSDTSVTQAPSGIAAHTDQHWGLRGTIAALAAFMALTTIAGAIFVVPTMPRSVLHQGVLTLFSDYTIPALALGVLCGGAALVTLVAVFARPQLGAVAAMVAGLFMVAFELVEIVVVGFTPLQTPDQFPAWLQVIYLAVGATLVILGARLWKAETGSYALRCPSV
jgi:DMSO reductase anchor subunit